MIDGQRVAIVVYLLRYRLLAHCQWGWGLIRNGNFYMLTGRLSIFTKYDVSNLPNLKCCAAYHKHHVMDSSAFAIVLLRSPDKAVKTIINEIVEGAG